MFVVVTVAPRDFADWPGLLRLLQTSFAYMDGRIDPPSSLHRLDEPALQAKARDEHLIVARDAGRLVGCAFADVRADVIYVGKLAVAADVRGRGIARALIDAADDLARRFGKPRLELQTRVELVENQRTFEALGFRKVAETAHAGFDRPTSITMQRECGPGRGAPGAAGAADR